MKRKPILGETLWQLNIGDRAFHCEQKLTPVVVKKVGRKFFTCGQPGPLDKRRDDIFYVDDWIHYNNGYSQDWKLYENPQDWEQEAEVQHIIDEIKSHFYNGRTDLPLAKLRLIKSIIDQA